MSPNRGYNLLMTIDAYALACANTTCCTEGSGRIITRGRHNVNCAHIIPDRVLYNNTRLPLTEGFVCILFRLIVRVAHTTTKTGFSCGFTRRRVK